MPADAIISQVETSDGISPDLPTAATSFFNQPALTLLDQVPEMVQEQKPTRLLAIDEASQEYSLTFETPAPYTTEEDTSTPQLYSKEITVAHDSALHYTDVKSYSDIPEDLVSQGIPFKLYWMISEIKADVTFDPRFAVELADTNNNGIADQMQWIVPKLSRQEFVIEAQISVINIQSYPVVGGNWTVRFTTTGTADLIITAVNGTTFGESSPDDLKFLELNDGTQTLTPEISDNSIIYRSYSSTAEGFEKSLVLTTGKHHLEFRFGNSIQYANNLANTAPVASDDSVTAIINTPLTINVLANDNDPDGDKLTVSSVTQATKGVVIPDVIFDTKWGSFGSANGSFNTPHAIAIDPLGNVYVADSNNDRIQKFDSSGNFITKWGTAGSGDGQFNFPEGLAIDSSDNVYVTDSNNNRIQKFDSSGNFITKWGSFGSSDGQFNFPEGLAIDSSDNVYVTDSNNNRIQKFTFANPCPVGTTQIVVGVCFVLKWGTAGSGDAQFNFPEGLAIDSSGNIFVADSNNNRIQKFDSSGNFITKLGSSGLGNGQFSSPRGVAVDSSGSLYVADTLNNRIQKFDSSSAFLTKMGSFGSDNGQFKSPHGVIVDSSGSLYVADSLNHRIQKFSPSVTYTPDSGFTGTDTFTYTISDGNAGTATANVTVNVIQRCNTTDHFGYSCKDSNFQAGPTFSWIDITSNGTQILADTDDLVINNIPIGFSFSFYEQSYTQLAISSNGLSLVDESSSEFLNQPIGSSNLPNNFIAPFWDDILTFDSVGAGTIYYQTIGVAPNRTFVVQWSDVQGAPNTQSGATFEAILYEGTNEIRFQYLDIDFEDPRYDKGVSATVGIESGDGRGLQYSFNEAALYDNLVVLFTGPSVSPPNAVNDSVVTNLNSPVIVDVLANDSDFNNDMLTITSVTNGIHGTVTHSSVVLTYTPNIGFNGTDTFTYTISDGHGGNDTATVTVLVTADNPPVAFNDIVLTKVNDIVTIDVLKNDTDLDNGDTLTIVSVKPAGSGIVTINAGFVTKWGLGTGNGEFVSPHDLAVDTFDNLYVVDTDNNRIQKFDSD
ncbi:MAG: Ig-like domain-containing protein, partial [Nitrososphaerales archaeon]